MFDDLRRRVALLIFPELNKMDSASPKPCEAPVGFFDPEAARKHDQQRRQVLAGKLDAAKFVGQSVEFVSKRGGPCPGGRRGLVVSETDGFSTTAGDEKFHGGDVAENQAAETCEGLSQRSVGVGLVRGHGESFQGFLPDDANASEVTDKGAA